MSSDGQSVAHSEGITLVNDDVQIPEERTTLAGNPIRRQHDHFTMVMAEASGGMGFGAAGANTLPPGYTDRSLVRIPIKMSDVDRNEIELVKKKGFFRRRPSRSDVEVKVVMMSRGEYLKYWAKGEDGNFLPTVVEPPEGRKEWIRQQLELNEEWTKKNPSLGKARCKVSLHTWLTAGLQ